MDVYASMQQVPNTRGGVSMSSIKHINRPCRGVGDFDTSDLPGGCRPTNDIYYQDTSRSKPSRVAKASTRMSRVLPGTRVETLRVEVRNGYKVTVNRYDGDDSKLQVFIDNPTRNTSILEYVSMDDLNEIIEKNTG